MAAVSGVLLDIDGDEAWQVEIRDAQGTVLDTVMLTPSSPNAGDGLAVAWSFQQASPTISSVRIAYVGGATTTGLAFDNFSPALASAPATLGIAMSPEGAQIQVAALFGATNRIEYADSVPATKWQVLRTVVHTNAPQESILDATGPKVPIRIYRAVGE